MSCQWLWVTLTDKWKCQLYIYPKRNVHFKNLTVCVKILSFFIDLRSLERWIWILSLSLYTSWIVAVLEILRHIIIKIVLFLFFSIFYIRRKNRNRESSWIPVLDAVTRFGIPWTRFHYFFLNLCLLVCVWHKFCFRVNTKADGWNCRKFLM